MRLARGSRRSRRRASRGRGRGREDTSAWAERGSTVSEIGFGAWGLGATMWRGVADDDALLALRAAVDAGVTFIDTALAYGDGHSERLIARRACTAPSSRRRSRRRTAAGPRRRRRRSPTCFPRTTCGRPPRRRCETSDAKRSTLQQFHVWHDAWLDQPGWVQTRREMENAVRRREGPALGDLDQRSRAGDGASRARRSDLLRPRR